MADSPDKARRAERLAQALRENLLRRKQQARAQASESAPPAPAEPDRDPPA